MIKTPAEAIGIGDRAHYCSPPCRKLADYELRRIDGRLARYEVALREAQADPQGDERAKNLRQWIAADEARLRELLGGDAA